MVGAVQIQQNRAVIWRQVPLSLGVGPVQVVIVVILLVILRMQIFQCVHLPVHMLQSLLRHHNIRSERPSAPSFESEGVIELNAGVVDRQGGGVQVSAETGGKQGGEAGDSLATELAAQQEAAD